MCIRDSYGGLKQLDGLGPNGETIMDYSIYDLSLIHISYWELVNIPTTGRLSAGLNAYIGKEDVMLFAGGLPDSFKEAYPFQCKYPA